MTELKATLQDLVSENRQRNLKQGVRFAPEDFPKIPETLFSPDISVRIRQRYVSNGKLDNLVLTMERPTATAIGLWILAVLFDPALDHYSIRLADSEPAKEIRMFVDRKSPAQFSLKQFYWIPKIGKETLPNSVDYGNRRATLRLTNEMDDWFDESSFLARDIIRGFGDVSGACLFAEFLLNLGISQNDLNYETLNHQDEPDNVLDRFSCELRIEIIES